MAGTIYRLALDEATDSADSPGSTQNWQVTGTESLLDVYALIAANVPGFDDVGNPLAESRPAHVGNGVWNVGVKFGNIPPLGLGLTQWEIDTTGGREKRYQSLSTRFQQASDAWLGTGGGVIDYAGAIGVTDSGVEGVEINVPKLSLVAKRKYNTGTLEADYLEKLYQLTAKINAAQFVVEWEGQEIFLEIGELLFLGAVISQQTINEIQIDHKFEASKNRLQADGNAVVLKGFSEGVQKNGWDYAWLSYMRTTNANAGVRPAQQYQAEQVYESGDFSIIQI